MHVLHVGWGCRPHQAGGTVAVTEGLMEALTGLGVRSSYLFGGRSDWRFVTRVSRWNRNGIQCIEVKNPPVLPLARGNDPIDDLSQPVLESIFKNVLAQERPDVVHIHDIVGWPGNIINISKDFGMPTVVSAENYWALCSRMTLFDSWSAKCVDYQGGARCVSCVATLPSKRVLQLARRAPFLRRASTIVATMRAWSRRLGFDRLTRLSSPEAHTRYRLRRSGLIGCLNRSDLIVTPSRRASDILVEHGLRADKCAVVRNALPHLAHIAVARQRRRPRLGQPVVFGYLGGLSPMKGVDVLVRAFREADYSKCRLVVWGSGNQRRVAALASGCPHIRFAGAYRINDLPSLLSNVHVGIVPSLCEDVYPTTVLEFLAAGIPVIGARTGGIPEQISEGCTGLLFSPGDHKELLGLVEAVLREPSIISRMSAAIGIPKPMVDYAREWLAVYTNLREDCSISQVAGRGLTALR